MEKRVWIIDNEYSNPHSYGSKGLESVTLVINAIIKPRTAKVIQGNHNIKAALNQFNHNSDPIVAFIHESLSLSFSNARQIDEREAVANVSTRIHEANPASRVVIYGFAISRIPLDTFIIDAQADAFWEGAVEMQYLEEIIQRSPVTAKEIRQRGRSIEIIGENKRLISESIALRARHLQPRIGE
jgi:hypothetical protein